MPFLEGLCPLLQTSLVNVAGSNTGFLHRKKPGFLDSLVSPINTEGFEQIQIANGNGGFRQLSITYFPAASRANLITSEANICTSPTLEVEPLDVIIDPSTFTFRGQTTRLFQMEEMVKLCQPDADTWRAQVMMSTINPLLEEIDRVLLTQAIQVFGNPYNTTAGPYTYVPPVAPLNARLIRGADNSAYYQGWYGDVDSRLQQMGVYGPPIAVGFGNIQGLNSYVRLNNVGCCNDAGIDLSRAADGSMYYFSDIFVDQILGQNQFFVYAPGAMQFLQFNKYTNRFGPNPRRMLSADNHATTTIIDPWTGIELDMKWVYEPCNETYRMTLFTRFQLFALPADMYLNTDGMFGVRNSLRFLAIPA